MKEIVNPAFTCISATCWSAFTFRTRVADYVMFRPQRFDMSISLLHTVIFEKPQLLQSSSGSLLKVVCTKKLMDDHNALSP